MRKEVIILFLSILTFSTFFLPCDQFSRSMVWIYVLTGIICALLFFLNKEYDNNIRMIFLRPSLVFVIAYLIVFFQRPIDYLLGYASGYLKIGEVRFMLTSLNYAVVGLSLFIIGYLIAAKRTRTGKDIRLHTNIVSPTIYAVLSSILVAFVIILVPKEVLLGGYNNDMLTNASIYNYLASWSNTILIAYLVQFTINAKQTEFGAVENRLMSVLEEISIQYDNLVSSRSTLRDADIAEVSSEYIRQQILQQASATLLSTANQSPSIALQLI